MCNLAVLADSPGLLPVALLHLVPHPQPLSPHLLHDLPRLLVLKLVQLLLRALTTALGLLVLALLLLLHDDLVADHLLHDDVLEDAGQ
jgi:hypothetical protein